MHDDHLLRTPEEYEAAIAEIHDLLDQAVEAGTNDYERLELLSVLAEAYEDAHTPEPRRASPQELVEFESEQQEKTSG